MATSQHHVYDISFHPRECVYGNLTVFPMAISSEKAVEFDTYATSRVQHRDTPR